jgi:hypothetical protein
MNRVPGPFADRSPPWLPGGHFDRRPESAQIQPPHQLPNHLRQMVRVDQVLHIPRAPQHLPPVYHLQPSCWLASFSLRSASSAQPHVLRITLTSRPSRTSTASPSTSAFPRPIPPRPQHTRGNYFTVSEQRDRCKAPKPPHLPESTGMVIPTVEQLTTDLPANFACCHSRLGII